MNIDKTLIETQDDWREKIIELEKLLDQTRPQLIEAEAKLTDRLAVIRLFEFRLRARIEPLARRLEKLQDEIQSFRRQLRHLQEDLAKNNAVHEEQGYFTEWHFGPETAASNGDYRYHETPTEAPPSPLNEDDTSSLKQLYRQLARRFHPDLALDAADRAYRTGIMKAINHAYAAGSLARLQELAQEPDSADRIEYAHTDQQLAQALYIELTRCRRRLTEIGQELACLEQHKSAHLLRRATRAEREGRDLLAEIAHELQEEIAHKMIERDILKQQIEQFEHEVGEYGGDDFADAVLELSYEGVFDGADPTITARWEEHTDWDEDILDDSD